MAFDIKTKQYTPATLQEEIEAMQRGTVFTITGKAGYSRAFTRVQSAYKSGFIEVTGIGSTEFFSMQDQKDLSGLLTIIHIPTH